MLRRLFALLSVLSMMLCVGVCVLWVWSYRQHPNVEHGRNNEWQVLGFYRGHAVVQEWIDLGDEYEPLEPGNYRVRFERYLSGSDGQPPWVVSERWFSLWWIWPPTIVVPIIHLLSLCGRHRQARTGFCSACGYDLRASPERCPECGAETKNPRRMPGGCNRASEPG
ncbi:MAG: hypothetical protein JWR03_417 [Cohnella sp.]|nr:hypothetical protein [Cohnella sp.]